MLSDMTGAVRNGGAAGAHRRPAAPGGRLRASPLLVVLLPFLLVLTACPPRAPEGDADASSLVLDAARPVLSAPVTAAQAEAVSAVSPARTVDLAPAGSAAPTALDVSGTPDGGAAVLLGRASSGPGPSVVFVSADGRLTVPVAVPGLTAAWDLHVLPDGSALASGRLADEESLGYAVIHPGTGAARTVAAVPLDEETSRAAGTSALSADGRTFWLYSTMLVDGRFQYLLTGHDVGSGGLVASRDLFLELRATHMPEQELDLVGLAPSHDGGVLLAVNAYPRASNPFARPLLLIYDASLEPVGDPVPLAPQEALVTGRALTTAPDGTALVALRGATLSWLVAFPPHGGAPEPRLEMAGFGFTDELVLDGEGRAVLPGRLGARRIDPATGAATDIDVGCAGVVTVRAIDSSPVTGTWILGGCLVEEERLRTGLWWLA